MTIRRRNSLKKNYFIGSFSQTYIQELNKQDWNIKSIRASNLYKIGHFRQNRTIWTNWQFGQTLTIRTKLYNSDKMNAQGQEGPKSYTWPMLALKNSKIISFFAFEVLSILHPIHQVFVDSHGFLEEEHLHVESFLQILLSV